MKQEQLPISNKTTPKLRLKKLFKYLFDFLVVFVGVFLAFWLTEQKDRREEANRKLDIYTAIYEDLQSFYRSGRRENEAGFILFFEKMDMKYDSLIDQKKLPVRIKIYGDYWQIEVIRSLIDSGHLKDIDIQTFKQVTRFNVVHQNFLRTIEDYNNFYDQHITTNYEKGIDYFYKPGTNELKAKYHYLYDAISGIANFSEMLVGISDSLSQKIKEKHMDR